MLGDMLREKRWRFLAHALAVKVFPMILFPLIDCLLQFQRQSVQSPAARQYLARSLQKTGSANRDCAARHKVCLASRAERKRFSSAYRVGCAPLREHPGKSRARSSYFAQIHSRISSYIATAARMTTNPWDERSGAQPKINPCQFDSVRSNVAPFPSEDLPEVVAIEKNGPQLALLEHTLNYPADCGLARSGVTRYPYDSGSNRWRLRRHPWRFRFFSAFHLRRCINSQSKHCNVASAIK